MAAATAFAIGAAAAALGLAPSVSGFLISSGVRAATPYTLTTEATYRVQPQAASAGVQVAVTFTNATPDRPGAFSSFAQVPLLLQPGASAVAARDAKGSLSVVVARGASTTAVTVKLRSAVRTGDSASFTLTYRLADRSGAEVRIGPSVVVMPVWSFGTAGTVEVRLPAGLTAGAIGATLATATEGDELVLRSGPIPDPAHWAALLTATGEVTYATTQRTVPLPGGTVDLRVQAWTDDLAWGASTLDLAATALPVVQAAIGLPYDHLGALVLTEALPVGTAPLSEPGGSATHLQVAFDAPAFTSLHQLAHLWLDSSLVRDRWIREGLALSVVADAAPSVSARLSEKGATAIAPPYDPAEQADRGKADAFALAEWGRQGAVTGAAADAWAYAASWHVVDEIAGLVGRDALRRVLERTAAGIGAYDTSEPGPGSPTPGSIAALDSRSFLDQLEQVSGRDLSSLFATWVFGPDEATQLAARPAARAAYAALVRAAGGWTLPEGVRADMEAWRFGEAESGIAVARAWLERRDRLVAAVRAAGLSVPDRLALAWLADGGGARSQRELEAEQALVDAYRAADGRLEDPTLVERLGLAGGPTPRELLATAAGLFASGDFVQAAATIERATSLADGAQGSGVVRLAAAVAAAAVIVAGTVLLARAARRRWYTPGP